MLVFFPNLSLMEFQVRHLVIFLLFTVIGSTRSWMGWEASKKCPINAGNTQGSIFGPELFLLYIHDLPDDVISDIAINAHHPTLYSKFDETSFFLIEI